MKLEDESHLFVSESGQLTPTQFRDIRPTEIPREFFSVRFLSILSAKDLILEENRSRRLVFPFLPPDVKRYSFRRHWRP